MKKRAVKQMMLMMLSVVFIEGQASGAVYAKERETAYVSSLNAKAVTRTLYIGGNDEVSKQI